MNPVQATKASRRTSNKRLVRPISPQFCITWIHSRSHYSNHNPINYIQADTPVAYLIILMCSSDLRAEDDIPEPRCHSKPHFVVLVVVFQMILLQLLEVAWQSGMMQHVVSDIIHDVTQGASSKAQQSIVVGEDVEYKLVEGESQHYKQSWRQNQSVTIHRQVVVNAMQQKVQGEESRMIRQILV